MPLKKEMAVSEPTVAAGFDQLFGSVPRWRRQPYRLLFPLGWALAWGGVLHWVLHAAGVLPDYRPVFHAIAQVQGFMTCLALGFLMTAIPRRTLTPPPSSWEMIAAMVLPPAACVAAWYGRLATSQVCWVLLVFVFIAFVLRRFSSAEAGRRPPNSFVWIPVALLMGVAGSFLTATPALLGDEYFWLHQLGRLLLLQGLLLGLVSGVGGMALPLITCGDAPPDARATARDRWIRVAHLAAAAGLVWSFWIEITSSTRVGLALRATIMTLLIVVGARVWRLPRRSGWHRWLVWLAAWMIPIGYAFAAVLPEQKKAGLHIVFIGGFALMAFSVALHVSLAHGDDPDSVFGRLWQVPCFGGLLLVAVVLRALVDFDPQRFFVWIGLAGTTFLVATLFWAWLVLPRTLVTRSR